MKNIAGTVFKIRTFSVDKSNRCKPPRCRSLMQVINLLFLACTSRIGTVIGTCLVSF